jgi:O-acetylserine/cysteine efflux transporter
VTDAFRIGSTLLKAGRALSKTPLTNTSHPIPRQEALAYTGLLMTMVVWSLVPVFLKKLLGVLSPTELSFTRFLLTGLCLLLWVLARRPKALVYMFQEDLKLLLLCTVFGPLSAMVCFNFAIVHLTIGTAAVFAAIEPLCTYLMAVIIGQEKWYPHRLASVFVAFGGITLVTLSRGQWGISYWVSLVLVTASPVIWAANNILTKNLVLRHPPVVMTSATFVLSSLFLIPTLGATFMGRLIEMDTDLWLCMGYCVVSSVAGFTIWYWSLRHLPPTSVAVSMYVIPILSVSAGMIFLDEPMSWIKAAGIGMVLVGIYLVNVRYR